MSVDELMQGDFLENSSDNEEGEEDEAASDDDGLSDGVIVFLDIEFLPTFAVRFEFTNIFIYLQILINYSGCSLVLSDCY